MRKYNKKKDVQIIEINDMFFDIAYIDPNFGYDSRYKYKAFYLEAANNYERLGVTKLECDFIEKMKYKQKHERVELICYSQLGGYFIINNAHYHAGKNYVNELDPFICCRSDLTSKYDVMKYDYIYKKEDVYDVLVIYAVLEKCDLNNNKYNIFINKNGVDKHCINNIVSYNYLKDVENTILYVCQKNKKKYSFYLYNYETNETEYLGLQDSLHEYETGINTGRIARKIKNSKRKVIDENNVYLYFSADSSIGCSILMEYIKSANGIEELENLFTNDTTRNYAVWFSKSRIEEIEFALYLINKYNIRGLQIYNYDIKDIAKTIDYGSNIYKFHMRNEYKSEYDNIFATVELLKEKFNLDDDSLVQFLAEEYGVIFVDSLCSRIQPYLQLKITHPVGVNGIKKENFENKIQKLYNNVMLDKVDSHRWKSELSLYYLVKMQFPESDYQFRASWLGQQSLDIFIVEHNVAIEYQGAQHYEAIDFFGGKNGLKATIERDRRKRVLCKENGVDLIEWKYDVPINIYNLRKMLLAKDIEIIVG